ncbi:uncharacterized protein LOC127083762 [Lathyrus oleraceus]|uniref:uncharacterized protein LOC127083762 n=1 Tax=Pisum sativum TaxID=3888 RepID=UPI0021D1522D|nr:uncharacterized protein LOC127083762 [Pisum sativum]
MGLSTSSASTQESSLQNPSEPEINSSPPRNYLAETPESSLRNPFEPDINLPQRNYLAERVLKRRLIEESQDESLIHGFELQEHAAKFLESNDLLSLQEAIDESDETKKESISKIFTSFELHYPNAFSLKLVNILQLHPPLLTRVDSLGYLLQILQRGEKSPLNSSILIELKNPLLHSFKVESEEDMFPWLCEAIGLLVDRLHQSALRGWEELLQYVYDCISGDSKLNNKKGLMLLTVSTVNREFWLNQGNFDLVFSIVSELVFSMDQELKALAYNSSISLISSSKDIQTTKLSDSVFPILLNTIDQHGEEVVLMNRIHSLLDLVTPGDGTILRGKHGDVFWCMIRVAEIEDASEELGSVAVNVIKELYEASVIKNLSHEELKRVLVVAMNMMSRVVDDPLWYDVDYRHFINVGMTDAFYRGSFLFNSLALDGDEGVFIPTAIETITIKYASDIDWRLRHAAMLAIGRIAEKNIKGDLIQYFDQVARLVLKSLDDLDPRVLWATMKAIEFLSEYKELLMHDQYHKKLLAKLVPIIRCNSCARVQLYAVIAIHSLVKSCGLDKISPFGESIIASLLALLKHEKQKLQVEAIDTLKSFAVLMPETFRQNHYDTTLEGLKVIVFDMYNLPRFLLFAQCLECMVYLVREVGPDSFEEQEVVQVMESVISLEEKLSNTEYLAKCFILKALDQICRCPRVSIDKYLDKLMPMLLGSAQLHLALTVDKLKDDYEKSLVETMIVWACNILSYCAVRSSINFFPSIGKVTALFTRLVGCSSFQIRKASVLGLPNLLLSLKVGDKNIDTKSGLTFFIVKSLIEVLKKETDRVLYAIVWSLLAKCIQTSSSYFNDKLIKVIADEIEDTIRMIIEIEITKAQELETSEGRCEPLPTEDRIQGVVHLITTTIDTFKDRFMPHVDDLLSNVVVFLADDNSDRVVAFAISIFNVILPLFPDKLPLYHDRYSLASCFALRRDYPCSELHATRAIGICAMYGGDQFKALASEGILRLYNVMGKIRHCILCDTAVAALGKIFEFHHDSIGPKAVQKWLNFLPLKHDFNEARYAHGLLSKLIQRSDEYLFGSNNENLAKIISIVKEILSGPDRLGSEEAINQMIDFIDQHGGVEVEIGG